MAVYLGILLSSQAVKSLASAPQQRLFYLGIPSLPCEMLQVGKIPALEVLQAVIRAEHTVFLPAGKLLRAVDVPDVLPQVGSPVLLISGVFKNDFMWY